MLSFEWGLKGLDFDEGFRDWKARRETEEEEFMKRLSSCRELWSLVVKENVVRFLLLHST